jgi:tryptophan synthase alpha chain
MTPLADYFWERKKKKGYLFVPYHAPGDPDWETSLDIVRTLIESGADSIEFGLPFSDPAADGPVLQRAFKRILQKPYNWGQFFKFLDIIHAEYPDMQFLTIGYANLFYQAGVEKIFQRLQKVGVNGVIIPDVPIEEKNHMKTDMSLLNNLSISWVNFITPTVTDKRLINICKDSDGFIYLVSYKGVTGANQFNLKPLTPVIKKVRSRTGVPILVGFGVKTAEHVRECVEMADGFIIASRLHEIIEHNLNNTVQIPKMIQKEMKKLLAL